MATISILVANWHIILSNLVAIFMGIIVICNLIPGINGHLTFLQKVVDFLKKVNVE